MQIEKNVAKLEYIEDNYRVVLTVERQHADSIKREDAEFVLTRALPELPVYAETPNSAVKSAHPDFPNCPER